MRESSPESTHDGLSAAPKPQQDGAALARHALRRGWTTGSCATAAAKSAVHALVHGVFLDPVPITLPSGQVTSFVLSTERLDQDDAEPQPSATIATASVIKDAGDDPDITHGASIIVTAQRAAHEDVELIAGEGVGTVTKAGLPIAVGQPSITPTPRAMITAAVRQVAPTGGFRLTISIPGGQEMAMQTMNPRLGVLGGLSILGTTGVVIPYSCASWIHSIHRGIDVARAAGLTHVLGATGATSEKLGQQRFGLCEQALLDMGDFAGGLLKYIRKHPIARLTLAGGIGKMSKLAQGELDLHSARSRVDLGFLAKLANNPAILASDTAAQALAIEPRLGDLVASRAARVAQDIVGRDGPIKIDTLVTTRAGQIVGQWTPGA